MKKPIRCSILLMRISAYLSIAACLPGLLPAIALATSASISLSGNEGAIPVQASATFTNHLFCDGNSPPNCWHDNSGTLSVTYNHPNSYNYYMGGQSGLGYASWSTTLDTGAMAQGTYSFTATACDSKRICISDSQSISIDNTPEVTATVSKSDGDLDIKGTVDFKEHAGGTEGRIDIWYLHPNGYRYFANRKYFEGTGTINWTWQEIVGSIPDAGTWAQGKYTVQVIAIANNGASKQIEIPINIDNTPEVTATVGNAEGDLDIRGTVDFKEHAGGTEGRIDIWYLHPNGYRYFANRKYYEGSETINWTWQEIVGSIPNAGVWAQGNYTVQVIAIANNGATKQIDIPISVDNTPKPSIDTPPVYFSDNTMEVVGTVLFKENDDGNPNTADTEGSITLYIAQDIKNPVFSQHGSTKSYEGKTINWKYSDFTSTRMSQSVWGVREFLVKIVATAANGAKAEVIENPLIPPQGCPYPPADDCDGCRK
jgi:hypothetical protein